MAAVEAVNNTIDKNGLDNELKASNRAFKEARRVDPSVRYFEYEASKVAILEALTAGRWQLTAGSYSKLIPIRPAFRQTTRQMRRSGRIHARSK